MYYEQSLYKRLRFYTNIVAIYFLTIVVIGYVSHPLWRPSSQPSNLLAKSGQKPHVPLAPKFNLVAGKPVRLVIPGSSIDLPVDEGYFNSADGSWTLSGYDAQFAMMSTLANNRSGDTFIYGHNNNYVFGALRHNTPVVGAQALVYTDNGHLFSYSFQNTYSVTPDNTATLSYKGAPILTIQTCTGSLDEWRTMYSFKFDKVLI